jgi:hypothetical protein
MAITLRNVKGTELSHAEMDTNLESYYYSSSLSGNTLALHTTGSDTHSLDLSGLTTTVNTGSFYVSSSISANNTITFTQGDGTTESVAVNTSNYVSLYDITAKSTSGPGTSRVSSFIAGASTISSGTTARTIRIPEIAGRILGDNVFITATYVNGDTDTPITVEATGQTGIPRTINGIGEIDFEAGGSTLNSDTNFMYHIIYAD